LAAAHGLEPAVATFAVADLSVQPRPRRKLPLSWRPIPTPSPPATGWADMAGSP
jgi:hypothetical protein